jgi:arylsulfatase A-like enzyme
LDLLPTIASLIDLELPETKILDGYDLKSVLLGNGKSPRSEMFYYRGSELYALRKGAFKAHFITELAYHKDSQREVHNPPLLYNLEHDPSEKYNIAADHPETIEELIKIAEIHKSEMVYGKDQLAGRR